MVCHIHLQKDFSSLRSYRWKMVRQCRKSYTVSPFFISCDFLLVLVVFHQSPHYLSYCPHPVTLLNNLSASTRQACLGSIILLDPYLEHPPDTFPHLKCFYIFLNYSFLIFKMFLKTVASSQNFFFLIVKTHLIPNSLVFTYMVNISFISTQCIMGYNSSGFIYSCP